MKISSAIIISLIVLFSGCASVHETFINNSHMLGPNKLATPNQAGLCYKYKNRIYSGIKKDAEVVKSCGPSGIGCIFAPLAIIDMPFSLVADTLFLPYTTTSNSINHENKYKPNGDMCQICKKNEDSLYCTYKL